LGATKWLALWIGRKWKKVRKGKPVANRDLWEQLQGNIDKLARIGTEVSFWLVSTHDIIKQSSALMRETKELARDVAAELYETSSQEPTGRIVAEEALVAPVQPLHFALHLRGMF
jgi:ribonuclease HI